MENTEQIQRASTLKGPETTIKAVAGGWKGG